VERIAAELTIPTTWLDPIPVGLWFSVLASLGTGIGGVPAVWLSRVGDRTQTLALSMGSGVMLTAATLSLLWPAVGLAQDMDPTMPALRSVAIALLLGVVVIEGLETLLGQSMSPDAEDAGDMQHRLWVFVLAIALHHLPEGFAVGLGTESTQDWSLVLGIAMQNVPEGLMVALALRQLGYSAGMAIGMAAVSGWLEPLGAVLGVALVSSSAMVVPAGMAFAAGAMVWVVVREMLPTLSLTSPQGSATVGLVVGVVAMGLMETWIG